MNEITEIKTINLTDDFIESLEWEKVSAGALVGVTISGVIHNNVPLGALTFLVGYYSADKDQPVFFLIFSDDITDGYVCYRRSLPLNAEQIKMWATACRK